MLTMLENLSAAKQLADFIQMQGIRTSNSADGAKMTLHPNGRLHSPLTQAQQAQLEERSAKPHKAKMQRHRELQSKHGLKHLPYSPNIQLFYYHFLLANDIFEYKWATCADYCAIAAVLLYLNNIPFEGIRIEYTHANSQILSHCFLVLGRTPKSDLKNIRTWGPNAVIVDIWENYTYATIKDILANREKFIIYQPDVSKNFVSARINIAYKNKRFSSYVELNSPASPIPDDVSEKGKTHLPERVISFKIAPLQISKIRDMFTLFNIEVKENYLCAVSDDVILWPMKKKLEGRHSCLTQLPKSQLDGYTFQPAFYRVIQKLFTLQFIKADLYGLLRHKISYADVTDIAHLRTCAKMLGKCQNTPLIELNDTESIASINTCWYFFQLENTGRDRLPFSMHDLSFLGIAK